MNKKVLKFEIDLDFVLIAITSSLKDYRLCYLVNRELKFNFTKGDDLHLDPLHGNNPAYFSIYRHSVVDEDTDFFFIANKGSEGYLIPEMNKTDYLLMIKNYYDNDELEKLITGLNRIPEIVAAVKVDPKKIKSRENLLF
ncbi:IPExxxVDY family protein [Mucilaginibacter sp. AW1-3]